MTIVELYNKTRIKLLEIRGHFSIGHNDIPLSSTAVKFRTDLKKLQELYNTYLTACRMYDNKTKNNGQKMPIFNPTHSHQDLTSNANISWDEIDLLESKLQSMGTHCPCNVNSCPAVNVYSCTCNSKTYCNCNEGGCCNNKVFCGNQGKCDCNSQWTQCDSYACLAHTCSCNCDGNW